MKKKNKISVECRQRLEALGRGFKVARRNRFLTIRQVSEISGVSVATLCRLERGCPGVAIGAYLSVLSVLGLENNIEKWVQK